MGFNRRKLEDQRRAAVEKEATGRRATESQVLEDAEWLIAAWNERQERRMPTLFSPTIGAAIAARYWFLWVRCPACRTINAIDLRDKPHPSTILPLMSAKCALFAELARLSKTSIAAEMREEYRRRVAWRVACGVALSQPCWKTPQAPLTKFLSRTGEERVAIALHSNTTAAHGGDGVILDLVG